MEPHDLGHGLLACPHVPALAPWTPCGTWVGLGDALHTAQGAALGVYCMQHPARTALHAGSRASAD